MTPGGRKLALTAHVATSVGWLGAVASFLALALAGLTGQDGQMVRAAYLATQLITWYVIVPLSVASLVTGLVQSLGTTWGVFRHYWVLSKLLIAVLATVLLRLHTQPIDRVARAAATTPLSTGDLRAARIQLVADAGAALVALLIATAFSVYKPWGMTAYGRRRQREAAPAPASSLETPRWVYVSAMIAAVFVLAFVLLHLAGRGLGGH